MTTQKRYTNQDIYTAIGRIEEKVDAVHEQAKKTNGRVTRLESIEQRREAVEAYIDKEGIKTPSEEKDGWTSREKALISIIMALLAVASAYVGGVVK